MGMALLMAAVLTLTSCGKDESFASKQRAERKAVEKFIKERGIEVLHRYPANGVFGKNQYYLIDDGLNEGKVYLHVIDSGNGNRAVMGRTDVLMRCSGEDFFKKETNNNVLTDEHIDKIIDLFEKKENVEYLSAWVDNEKIAENDYNLSVSAYVEAEDTREAIDITALNAQVFQTVKRIDSLRADIEQIIAEIEK